MGDQLFTLNVGDSRIIMVSIDKQDKQLLSYDKLNLIVKQLTEDHKPHLNKEKDRIMKQGGVLA